MSFAHYARKSDKRYARFAYIVCPGCYAELGAEGQAIYSLCERDCHTYDCDLCRERREADEESDPRELNYSVLATQPD